MSDTPNCDWRWTCSTACGKTTWQSRATPTQHLTALQSSILYQLWNKQPDSGDSGVQNKSTLDENMITKHKHFRKHDLKTEYFTKREKVGSQVNSEFNRGWYSIILNRRELSQMHWLSMNALWEASGPIIYIFVFMELWSGSKSPIHFPQDTVWAFLFIYTFTAWIRHETSGI